MRMDAVLSQLYSGKSAQIGAAPKKEEKAKESFAKMIDGVCIMKIKPGPNWVRYTVKLPFEKTERYVVIKPGVNENFYLFVSTPVTSSADSCLPDAVDGIMSCKLNKSEDNYTATRFSYGITDIQPLEDNDKKILVSILQPLSKAEEEPEYKKMIDAAIKSLK